MMHRGLVVGILAALCMTHCVGCGKEKGPEIGQVTGVVRVKGKPQKGLAIRFLPEPLPGVELPINAAGFTDEQGKYELMYAYKDEKGPGAPVGMHRVLVDDSRYSSIPQGAPVPPRMFSTDYGRLNLTPLKVEVKPGPQTIDLDLK